MMRMFIYEPAGDTLVDTILTHITTPDGTTVDIIVLGIPEISSSARVGMHFFDTPVPLHWIPLEYADADSVRILNSGEWISMSLLGIRAYPFVSLLFVEPSTGGMEFLPGGDRRRVVVDMPSKMIFLEGDGIFTLTTLSGRVIVNRRISGSENIFLGKLAPGIYIYRFGGVSGKIVIR